MSKLFLLYRTLRRCDSFKSSAENENSIPVSLIVNLVFILCAVVGIGYVGWAFAGLFELFGGISVVLSVLSLVMGVVIAVKGLIQLINSLYMSTDTSLLITMPVSPLMLATVRVINVLLGSFLITAGVLLSFAAGYSLAAPAGLFFWFVVGLYVIIIPLFVTLAVTILAIVFMSVFRIFRSRNALKYLGVLGAFIGLIAYMGYTAFSTSDIDMGKVIGTVVNVFKNFTYVIPVVSFICKFMETRNFLYVLLAVLLTAAVAAVYVVTAKALYLKGAIHMQDASGSSKSLEGGPLEKACTAKSQYASYRSKEMLLIRRNPVYLLKNFIVPFIWPVIFIPMVLLSMLNDTSISENPEEMAADVAFDLSSDICLSLVLALGVVFMVVLLLNMISDLAYSSITREGETFAVLKQIPVSFREQVRVKRNIARNIIGITTLGYLTVGAVVGLIFGVVPWYTIPYGLLAGIPLLYLVVDIDMIFGIRKANLHWDNETAAIKKDARMTVGSYLCMVAVIVALLFFYSRLETNSPLGISCLLAVPALLIVAAFLIDRRMYAIAEEKLKKL